MDELEKEWIELENELVKFQVTSRSQKNIILFFLQILFEILLHIFIDKS